MISDWKQVNDNTWEFLNGPGKVARRGSVCWVAWYAGHSLGAFTDRRMPELGQQMAMGCVERAKQAEDNDKELAQLGEAE
jgi:hypothetical protein